MDKRDRACAQQAAEAGTLLTAVDLGSNSFYLMQAHAGNFGLAVTQRLRESVRLVAGVDTGGMLDAERQRIAFECLERFGQVTRPLESGQVRVVATSAVRRLARPQQFLQRAGELLGHAIEIIDGQEEGRLIWLGAHAALPADASSRLVIDIGGGSTECIVGTSARPAHVASVDIGCIVTCTAFFADGALTPQRWQRAQQALRQQIAPHVKALHRHGWDQAWGTSGSARAIGAIVRALGTASEGISAEAISDLRQRLLAAGQVERLQLPELDAGGRHVIAGTTAVLEALFAELGLGHMALCDAAMREGILRDLAARHAAGTQAKVR